MGTRRWLDALERGDFGESFRLFQQEYDENYLDTIVGACVDQMVHCTEHAQAAAECLLALRVEETVAYWTPYVAAHAAIGVVESSSSRKVSALRLVASCNLCRLDERWNRALRGLLEDDSPSCEEALIVALEIVEKLEDDDALTMCALSLSSRHPSPRARRLATQILENSDRRRSSLSVLLLTRMDELCRDWRRLGRESLRVVRAVLRACCGEILFDGESEILDVVADLGGSCETWRSLIDCLSSSNEKWPQLAEKHCRTLTAPFERRDLDDEGLDSAADLAVEFANIAKECPRPFAHCWEALHLRLARIPPEHVAKLLRALTVPIEFCSDDSCFEDVKGDTLLHLMVIGSEQSTDKSLSEAAWLKFVERKDAALADLVDFALDHPFFLPSLLAAVQRADEISFKTAIENMKTVHCDDSTLECIGKALANNHASDRVVGLLSWAASQRRRDEDEDRIRDLVSIVWRAAALASSSPLLSAWPLLEMVSFSPSSAGDDSFLFFEAAKHFSQRMLHADTIGEVAEVVGARFVSDVPLTTTQRQAIELVLQKARSSYLDSRTRRQVFACLVGKYVEDVNQADWPLVRSVVGTHQEDDLETVAAIASALAVAARAAFATPEPPGLVIARELGRNLLRALCVAEASATDEGCVEPRFVQDATTFLVAVVDSSSSEDVCIWARRAAVRLDEFLQLRHDFSPTSSLDPKLSPLLTQRVARLTTKGRVKQQNESSPPQTKRRKMTTFSRAGYDASTVHAVVVAATSDEEQGHDEPPASSHSPHATTTKWAAAASNAYTPTMDSTSSSQTLLLPQVMSSLS